MLNLKREYDRISNISNFTNIENKYESYEIPNLPTNIDKFQFIPTFIDLTNFKITLDSIENTIYYPNHLNSLFPIEFSVSGETDNSNLAFMFLPSNNFSQNLVYSYLSSTLNGYVLPQIDSFIEQNNLNGVLLYFPSAGNFVYYFKDPLFVNGEVFNQITIGTIDPASSTNKRFVFGYEKVENNVNYANPNILILPRKDKKSSIIKSSEIYNKSYAEDKYDRKFSIHLIDDDKKFILFDSSVDPFFNLFGAGKICICKLPNSTSNISVLVKKATNLYSSNDVSYYNFHSGFRIYPTIGTSDIKYINGDLVYSHLVNIPITSTVNAFCTQQYLQDKSDSYIQNTNLTNILSHESYTLSAKNVSTFPGINISTTLSKIDTLQGASLSTLNLVAASGNIYEHNYVFCRITKLVNNTSNPLMFSSRRFIDYVLNLNLSNFTDFIDYVYSQNYWKLDTSIRDADFKRYIKFNLPVGTPFDIYNFKYDEYIGQYLYLDSEEQFTLVNKLKSLPQLSNITNEKIVYKIEWSQVAPIVPLNLSLNAKLTFSVIKFNANSNGIIFSNSLANLSTMVGWPIRNLQNSQDWSAQLDIALPCILSMPERSFANHVFLTNSMFMSQYAFRITLNGYIIQPNQGAYLSLPLIIKNIALNNDVLNMYDKRLKDEFSIVIVKRGNLFSPLSMNTYNNSNIGNSNFLFGTRTCSLQQGKYYYTKNAIGNTLNRINNFNLSTSGIPQISASIGNSMPCIQNILGINSNIVDGMGGDSFMNRSFGSNINLPNYILITHNFLLIDGKGVYGEDMIKEYNAKLFNDTNVDVIYDVYCISKYFYLCHFLKNAFFGKFSNSTIFGTKFSNSGFSFGQGMTGADLTFNSLYSISIVDILPKQNLNLNYSKPKILVDKDWNIKSKIPIEYFIYPLDLFFINSSSSVIPSPPYIFGIESFDATLKGSLVYYRNLRIPSIHNFGNFNGANNLNVWRYGGNINSFTKLGGQDAGNIATYFIIIPKNLVITLTSLIPNLSNLKFSTGEGIPYMPKVSFVTTPTYGDTINHQMINGFLTTNLVNFIVNLGGVVVKSYLSIHANISASTIWPYPAYLFDGSGFGYNTFYISDVYFKCENGVKNKIEMKRFYNPISTNLQLTILGDLLLDSTTQKPICKINPVFGFNTYAISLKGDLICQVNNPISENSLGHLALGRCISGINTQNYTTSFSSFNNNTTNTNEYEKILYGSVLLDFQAIYTNSPSSNNLLISDNLCSAREHASSRVCEFILVYEDNPTVKYTYNGIQMTATEYLDAYIEGGNLAIGYTLLRCPGNNGSGTYLLGGRNTSTNFNSPYFVVDNIIALSGSQFYKSHKFTYTKSLPKSTFPDNVKWYLNYNTTNPTVSSTSVLWVNDIGTHFKSTWMQYMKKNGIGNYVPSLGMTRIMNGDSKLFTSSSNTSHKGSLYGISSFLPTGADNNPTAFTNYYNSGQGFEFNSPSIGGHVLNTVSYTPNTNNTVNSGYTFTKYTKTKVLSFFINEYKIINSDVNLIKNPNITPNLPSSPNLLGDNAGSTSPALYDNINGSLHPLEAPGFPIEGISSGSFGITNSNDARSTSGFLFGEMFGCFGQIPKVYYHEQGVRPDTYKKTHTTGGQNYQVFVPSVSAVALTNVKRAFIQFGNKSVSQELPFALSTYFREWDGLLHDEFSDHLLKSRICMFKPRTYPTPPANFIWTDRNTNNAIPSNVPAYKNYNNVDNTTLGTGSTPQYSIYKGLRLKEDILNYIDTGYNVPENFVEIMGNNEKQVMDSLGSLVQITGPTNNEPATNQQIGITSETTHMTDSTLTTSTLISSASSITGYTHKSPSFPVIGFCDGITNPISPYN